MNVKVIRTNDHHVTCEATAHPLERGREVLRKTLYWQIVVISFVLRVVIK